MKTSQLATAEGVLFTDQYQLAMAQVYFRHGLASKLALFDYFFRDYPNYDGHQAGFCVNAGLEWLLDWMAEAHFRKQDLEHLQGQRSAVGQPLFAQDFLEWLGQEGSFHGFSLRAIPEGRVVHPRVPLVQVSGPLALAQILETPLLNHLNYQTLVATKAARIKDSARGGTVLEFGLRRAQGKGANAGARAALIGGADFSSNVGISHLLGFPPKGTHAHSMVQVFLALGMDELDAFRAFASIYPDDCILLVDTIDTLESGIPNAIRVFEALRAEGHEPLGVRLDSGDLAYLSIQAAKMLDAAGFPAARIVLSNNLDELVIWQITTQVSREAGRYGVDPDSLIRRLVYGVGTRLITSWGEPALGGVYKLVAIEDGSEWLPALKLSETADKIPIPGPKKAWRIYDQRGMATVDLLCLAEEEPANLDPVRTFHPVDPALQRTLPRAAVKEIEPLLIEVMHAGRLVGQSPKIEEIRQLRDADLARLDPGVRRLINPHVYHVSLSERLQVLKQSLIETTGSRS
ncbi:MAG TPA: nicotinate phosphoribosyltransferase [Anaerolineales bacterium]|nr:nicotinate phosphoribosyltransferase [Anaerolineales bacterium]